MKGGTLIVFFAGWSTEPQQAKNRIFNCRFLVKPPDDKEQTMEQKQQRVNKYETMQICSAHLANNSDRLESGDVSSESSDIGPCVMCVARKIPENEVPNSTSVQQFTFKLDLSGKILALDNSGLREPFNDYLSKVNSSSVFNSMLILWRILDIIIIIN